MLELSYKIIVGEKEPIDKGLSRQDKGPQKGFEALNKFVVIVEVGERPHDTMEVQRHEAGEDQEVVAVMLQEMPVPCDCRGDNWTMPAARRLSEYKTAKSRPS